MSMARPRKRNQRKKQILERLSMLLAQQNWCGTKYSTYQGCKVTVLPGKTSESKGNLHQNSSHILHGTRKGNPAINMEACNSLAKAIPSRRSTSGGTTIQNQKKQRCRPIVNRGPRNKPHGYGPQISDKHVYWRNWTSAHRRMERGTYLSSCLEINSKLIKFEN